MLRQTQQEEDENLRHELDNELDSIRSLLFAAPPAGTTSESSADKEPPTPVVADLPPDDQDKEYDHYVRELALDRRAKPKDRTKTEEELALEEKEVLEKAERRRIRRMNGAESESDDEGPKAKRKRSRPRSGDDLEDDFYAEDGGLGGLGAGLGEGVEVHVSEMGSGEADNDEEGSQEGSGEDDSGEEDDKDGSLAEDFDSASEDSGDEDGEAGESEALVKTKLERRTKSLSAAKELPYTFPCPATHDELLEIVDDVDDKDIPTVIKRIRTLYHPSLAQENRVKLQVRRHDHLPFIIAERDLRRA